MHGKGKIVLDVPKTSSRLQVKYSFVSIELKWKNIYVFGIKHICRRGRNWFPVDSSNLSSAPNYISPRWINISLLTITSTHAKHFWGARATDSLWSGLHCWTVDCATKSTALESDSIWVDVQTMEPNISDLCPQTTKALLLFPTTYPCEAVFQRYNYF